ncbi:MAG: M20 family metallopeptidase [Rhodospirillales bacterium]|jgi:glutamate carboxypeptidase|nr:M20 family metallopeptidase [Rhodospirillales bacterium]
MTSVPGFDTQEILDGIREWVEIESPTDTPEATNRMVDKVEADFAALGGQIDRIPGTKGFGDCLKVRTPWGGDTKGILVIGHLDTVHPMGTIERLPFRVEGDIAYGPGIFDMKGGAFFGFHAFRNFFRQGKESPLPITFLFNTDEEMCSRSSRDLIIEEAHKHKYVLVLEPARDGGNVVGARKGTARFVLDIQGRPAHSGSRHADGRSAIKEMARQIIDIENMTDYERELTVNVGVLSGGSRPNVIPEFASAEIDMRLPTKAIADEMIPRIANLKPYDPDVTITVSGGAERPPFEQTPAGVALFEHARKVGAELGMDLEAVKAGGASDANFAGPISPALDGLGVNGDGAHTMNEQITVSLLAQRAELFYRLLDSLE